MNPRARSRPPAPYPRLVRAAAAARRRAYAPYSRFAVGAAVLARDGAIVTGCNVENVSLGLTQCAERVAIQTAVAGGRRRLDAVAVVGPPGVTPCGACRQVMQEFGVRVVVLASPGRQPAAVPLGVLLPVAFERPRPRSSVRPRAYGVSQDVRGPSGRAASAYGVSPPIPGGRQDVRARRR